MGKHPERTCIGCRGAFNKNEVIRIVAGPEDIVIDYREKLPGRAAYICPRLECIRRALTKDAFSRALKTRVKAPSLDGFLGALQDCIRAKISSLVAMSAKAGMLAAGYSAVLDALTKERVKLLIVASDLADGTREKIEDAVPELPGRRVTMFTREEMGRLLGRELVGIAGMLDQGFSDAVWKESQRLKGLLNAGQ